MWTSQRELNRRLDQIERKINAIIHKENDIMATLADLQAQVAAVGSTEDSAVALITGLIAKIQDLINSNATPEQYQALVDDLKSHTDPLAAAVAANTP
jgi:cell division septum initiation protein DivIVA